jgi:amino acid adenylation domain-containing protein
MATIAPPNTAALVSSLDGSTEVPDFETYMEHFNHVALRHLDRCALSCAGEFVTYGALRQRACDWADRFREHGCAPETLVAVCVDRSMDLVPLLLGVLMAGAAFLPLDPEQGTERVRSFVERSGATLVVTQRRHSHIFDQSSIDAWYLESPFYSPAKEERNALHAVLDPAALAYLIHTSGSTGGPKAVAITHASFYHYVSWAIRYYGFATTGVSVLHSSIAFDLTITSIFCPLLLGMRIVVVPEGAGIEGLASVLDDPTEYVSLLKLTPSHLQLLLAASETRRSWHCGALIVGGEQLSAGLVRFWEQRCEAGRIFNEYGPTEATVGCCVAQVRPEDAQPSGAMPIGCAIDNVKLHLSTTPRQISEDTGEGELSIGGKCLARGYSAAPAATAEKFIPDPTGDGDRLYRSGDWVRRIEGSGEYVFAGRKDRQVKLSGIRVELDDIEHILREFPGIQDALVVIHPDTDGKAILLAFLSVAHPDSDTIDLASLDQYLRARLHASLVPSSFYLLKRFPLAASGKVHVEKLIRERATYPSLSGAYLPPRTPTEELLASLWRAVLGREEIGIDDSFFALDGNSMKSIQFVYEARKHGLMLTTRDVFERQTIRALAELIDLPVSGRSEFEPVRLSNFALVDSVDRERISCDASDAYPLAMLQAGTLFESNADFGSGTYHNVNSYHLECELNIPLLERALALIISRHPILRTCYDYVNYKEPLQLVYREAKAPLLVVDISHLSEDQQDSYVAEFVDQEAKNHFDWSKPPLFRIFVHLRGQRRFQFTLSKHHSILDGWSAATLIAEMMQNYFALLKDQIPPYQIPLERTYREYVALERESVNNPEHREFWRQTLQEAPQDSFRPWGNERPTTNGSHSFAASRTVPIDAELSGLLKEVARRARAPLKSVLLAAHFRALAEMTGNTRLVTGVVSHGRPDSTDADRALGLFINTVPFYIGVEQQFTWFDLIRRVFAEERRVFPYQRYPMARMKKDAGGRNLFESIFYYTDFHVFRQFRDSSDARCLGSFGFEQTEIPFTAAFSRHPLTSEISLVLHFHASHFSEPQTAAIVGYFKQALTNMAQAPERPVLSAPLFACPQAPNPSWTSVPFPRQDMVFDLFREAGRNRPDAIALATFEYQLTYGALLRRVGDLARALSARGSLDHGIVGICLRGTLEMLISLLAVSQLRACFVILDPQWPNARLMDVLGQLEPTVVIVDSECKARFDSQRILDFDLANTTPVSEAPFPQKTGDPDDLAYIVFTSGSTGRPKGVMVTHRNLSCSTVSRLHYYGPCCRTFLLLSRLTFDSAYAGIWGTLCSGGTLHLAETDQMMDVALMAERVQDDLITHFLAIPSFHRLLLKELEPVRRLALQGVILAGEELTRDVVQAQYAAMPSVALFNEYGPSEATIWATASRLDPERLIESTDEVPIGRTLEHLKTLVLTPDLRIGAPGILGELCLCGPGVGRGYWKDPRFTAERFVPNPYSVNGMVDAVLYRTGDYVRQLPNGELTFVRRGDNQVKVRGFRIEIEEIERVFYQSFTGFEVIVRLRKDVQGRKRICLYYAPCEGSQAEILTLRQVRRALGNSLPTYSLPDEVIKTSKLPRLANNKVDRSIEPTAEAPGLPDPPAKNAIPSSEIERALSRIWRHALSLPSVDVRQSFFEMGGDSLLANQIVLRAEKIFGVRLPLKEFYEEPVIAAHAALLANKGRHAGIDFEKVASIWNRVA